jgi:hypothetical protein
VTRTPDAPNTVPLQEAADLLRGLLVDAPRTEQEAAVIAMGADMLELVADWVLDQHRMLTKSAEVVDALNSTLADTQAVVDQLLRGRGPS